MLRRKLRVRTDDLKELMLKPMPIWYTSCSYMKNIKLSRFKITTN
jgi:hypothetical protein